MHLHTFAQSRPAYKKSGGFAVVRSENSHVLAICLQLKRLLSPLLRTDRTFLSCYNDSEKIDEADSSDIS